MEFIPAIDLLDGRLVRLHKGDYDKVTVYSDDPSGQAKLFQEQGAKRLHVVDLDGARDGKPGNTDVIEGILRAAPGLAVQIGGGVRNAASAKQWLDLGASRVVMGTAAIREPEATRELSAAHPGRLVIALDARDGMIAVAGWREATDKKLTEVAADVDSWGVGAILFTDIDRDGTREGPAVEATASLQSSLQTTVIASGGIAKLEDLSELRAAGVRAAVCGRAIYAGEFNVAQALEVCVHPE
jgi:phosphoribosylformimino-5-aminoimidazole carboxamide ribotide isomerase